MAPIMDKEQIAQKLEKLKEKQEFVNTAWNKTGNRELLNFLVEIIPRLFNCDRGSIFIHDPMTDNIWLQCGTGVKERQISVPKSNSLVGQTIHSGRFLSKSDMEHQSGAHEMTDLQTGFTTRNAICMPIHDAKGEKVIGAIELMNKRGDKNFDDEDRKFLEKVCKHINHNVEQIFMRQELIKISLEITKKIKKIEQEMK